MSKAKKLTKNSKIISKIQSAKIIYAFLLIMFISTVFSLIKSQYSMLILKLIGFAMLFASAKLIDMGLKNEYNYNSATIAYAPKAKYKLFGSILLGITIFYLSYIVGHISLINSIITAILGVAGAIMYYGQDPYKDKLPQDIDINMEKVLKDLKEAEDKLLSIEEDANDISDYELKNAINKATKKAQDIIENIKQDPKDIRVARKFMVVYLDGIKDVINKYKSIDKELLDSSFKERLIELLDSATKRFEEDLERLKSNEIFDLDVQIDSLKQQLK